VDCCQIRQQLNELVDLELDEDERQEWLDHLAGCSECAMIYDELMRMKKLVHAKARRPAAPAGLANLTRQRVARSVSSPLYRRKPVAAAAVAALSVTTIAVFLALSTSTTSLAHPHMVRCCLDEFLRVTAGVTPSIPDDTGATRSGAPIATDVALESIRTRTGVVLDTLPEIDGGTFHRSEPCSFDSADGDPVRGVRLDYRVVDHERKLEYPACIFVFPLECLECPDSVRTMMKNGKVCHCAGKTDKTIYCFRSTQHVYNLVTTLDSSSIEGSRRPRLR